MSLIGFESINDIRSWVAGQKAAGLTLGFVPTMGALHFGHISLINRAKQSCDKVIVSIFVNPTQFNNPDDLKKYPRTLESDILLLEAAKCDVLFHPKVEEMYPEETKGHWNFGLASEILEGFYRPGHFDGVLTIVKRLFEVIQPDKAFFGEKDFQQLTLITKMTLAENLPVQIVACPSVREESGLALSSRNMRLNSEERLLAAAISRVLFAMREKSAKLDPVELVKWGQEELNKEAGIELEYLEMVDTETFESVESWRIGQKHVVLVAAYIGGVRLIDNILI